MGGDLMVYIISLLSCGECGIVVIDPEISTWPFQEIDRVWPKEPPHYEAATCLSSGSLEFMKISQFLKDKE